jgi:hypothetical protein
MQGLDNTENTVDNVLSDISGDSDHDESKGCTHSLFSLLSCIVKTISDIEGTIQGIKGSITDDIINAVKTGLSDLEQLTEDLDENKEDDQTSSGESSSTTSSSCTQTSVTEDLFVTCSPSPVTTGTITTTTEVCRTSTSTVSGCTVSAFATTTTVTSSSSTATPTSYIVYPKQGSDSGQTDSIKQILEGFVEQDSDLFESDCPGHGVNYWTLPLTADDLPEVKGNLSDVSGTT